MEQKAMELKVIPNTNKNTQSASFEFIIKLLTDGYLRQLDIEMNDYQKNISFPKEIYEQTLKLFPRFDTAQLLKSPLLNLNIYCGGCYLNANLPSNVPIITECTQKIRKFLSIERSPPIDAIIDSGITPKFIEFLNINYTKYSELQFEACWSLTNICSGTRAHVKKVISNANAIPYLIQLLNSENVSIKEQSIWALGNVCGDSFQCRNHVLSLNILPNLIPVIYATISDIANPQNINTTQQKNALNLLRNATWTISNLCRGKPAPDVQYIIALIPVLNSLLTVSDIEVIQDVLWAYSYVTETPAIIPKSHFHRNKAQSDNIIGEGEGPPQPMNNHNNAANGDGPVNANINIEMKNDINEESEQTILELMFLSDGVLSTIVNLLDHSSPHLIHPALRILGNICTCTDRDTQRVLDSGILDKLYLLLAKESVNKRSPIKREALWTISNILAGTEKQIQCVIGNKPQLFPILNDIMINAKYELSKEAVWCIANVISGANNRQIDYLIIHQSIIPNLCKFIHRFRIRFKLQILDLRSILSEEQLDTKDRSAYDNISNFDPSFSSFASLRVVLEGIEKILTIENGKYALFAEQYGLLYELERLLETNERIVQKIKIDNANGDSYNSLTDPVLVKCNALITTYYSDSPSQIVQLLVCDELSQRKKCCSMLKAQLKHGSIYHCTRIIQCRNMIGYLLKNLYVLKNDIFIKNEIVFILNDLLKKLDNSLKFLNDVNDVNNIIKIIHFIIDQSVILSCIDFLLRLIKTENANKYENDINIGKTIYLIMEIIEVILKYKNEEIYKFFIIKYDGVYAMKEIMNNYYLNHLNKEIINISSRIMKQYFKFNLKDKNVYPNFEKTLVNGFFREANVNVNSKEIVNIIEVCCYYGYDYSFEQNKRRSSIIIESHSLLKNSTSDLVEFDNNEDDEPIDYDNVLLDLNFD